MSQRRRDRCAHVHSTQTRRWPDGSELYGTGVIGGWGRWPAFYAAMALNDCARPIIAQVPVPSSRPQSSGGVAGITSTAST